MKTQKYRYLISPVLMVVLFLGVGVPVVGAVNEADLKQFVLNIPEGKDAGYLYRLSKGGKLDLVTAVQKNVIAPLEKREPLKEYSIKKSEMEKSFPKVVEGLSNNIVLRTFRGAENKLSRFELSDPERTRRVDLTNEPNDAALQKELQNRFLLPAEQVAQAPAVVEAKKEEVPAGVTPAAPPTPGTPPVTPRERPTPTPAPSPQPCYFYYNAPLGYFPGAMRGPQPVDAGFVQKLIATYGVSGVQQGLGLTGNTFAAMAYNNMKWMMIPVPCDLQLPAPPVVQPPAPPVTPPPVVPPPEEPELVQICWFDPFTGSVAWTGIAVVGGEIIDSPAPGYNPMGFYGGTTVTFPPGVTPFPYGPVTTTVIQTPYGTSYTVTCGYMPEEFFPPQPEPPIEWEGDAPAPAPRVPGVPATPLVPWGVVKDSIREEHREYQVSDSPKGIPIKVGIEARVYTKDKIEIVHRFVGPVQEGGQWFRTESRLPSLTGKFAEVPGFEWLLEDMFTKMFEVSDGHNVALDNRGIGGTVFGQTLASASVQAALKNPNNPVSKLVIFAALVGNPNFVTDGGGVSPEALLKNGQDDDNQVQFNGESTDPEKVFNQLVDGAQRQGVVDQNTAEELKKSTTEEVVDVLLRGGVVTSSTTGSDSKTTQTLIDIVRKTGGTVTFHKDGGTTFNSGKDSTTRTVSSGTTSSKTTTETKSSQKK